MSDHMILNPPEVMGISGRMLGAPGGGIGVFGPSTDPRRAEAAARYWPQGRWDDFDRRDGFYFDKATGMLYREVNGEPLLHARPQEAEVALFLVRPDGGCVFLQRTPGGPSTLEELDAAAAEKERRIAEERQAVADWRASQPRRVMLISDVRRNSSWLTLRAAARWVLDNGGTITLGEYGEVVVEMPERLVHDNAGLARPLLEQSEWAALKPALETLRMGERVVTAALQKGGRRRLDEVLPDAVPTAFGGVAA